MDTNRMLVEEVLKIRGASSPAIDLWWNTPLVGLGGETPSALIDSDPERVAGVAKMFPTPRPIAKRPVLKPDARLSSAQRQIRKLQADIQTARAELARASETLRAEKSRVRSRP